MYPGSRKIRGATKKHPASGAGSSRGRAPSRHPPDVTNACDDDDDDFMPPIPSGHPSKKQAAGEAGSSRGRAPSGHPPNETPLWDDDDDFMPRPPPRPPCSPENPEDEAPYDPSFPMDEPPIRLPPIYPPLGNSAFYLYRPGPNDWS